jgi:hypothetical protein
MWLLEPGQSLAHLLTLRGAARGGGFGARPPVCITNNPLRPGIETVSRARVTGPKTKHHATTAASASTPSGLFMSRKHLLPPFFLGFWRQGASGHVGLGVQPGHGDHLLLAYTRATRWRCQGRVLEFEQSKSSRRSSIYKFTIYYLD